MNARVSADGIVPPDGGGVVRAAPSTLSVTRE